MTKLFSRVLSLILVFAFCFTIVACTKNPDDNTDSGSETESSTAATPGPSSDNPTDTKNDNLDASGYLKDDLPDDLNTKFNGKTVTFLYWEDVEKTEFEPVGDMSDDLDKNLMARNQAVSDRLGITIEFRKTKGNNNNVDNFLQEVKVDYENNRELDIIGTYSRSAGKCASRGYFRDLNNINYIDTSKPWYPDQLLDSLDIGGKLYFISGDASVNTLYLMYTVYFNKNLIEEYRLENPQDLVANKQWTIDKLIQMTKDTYQNLDGDGDLGGSYDTDDFYGFCTIYYGVDAFYTGSGLKLVDNTDKTKIMKISDDFTSEKSNNLLEKLGVWLTSADCNVYTGSTGKNSDYRVPFVKGNALFCQERCYLPENYLIGKEGKEGVDFDYGVLPTPLFDESQENYITCLGNPFSLYSISRGCKDDEVDMLGAFIECWSSESYRKTTPALFEVNMQLKYAQDSVDAQMFDICKKTITTDLGRVFSKDLNMMSELWSKAASTNANWASQGKTYKTVLNNLLKSILKGFEQN